MWRASLKRRVKMKRGIRELMLLFPILFLTRRVSKLMEKFFFQKRKTPTQ